MSNTGPLVALAVADRLDVLKALFDRVVVPEAVHVEIRRGGPMDAGLSAYARATWIEVAPPRSAPDALLMAVLDKGEAAVIQLARAMPCDYVLIDEQKARKIARSVYALRVIGTVGVLVEAKRQGLLDSVGKLLSVIRQNGYWLDDRIVDRALRESGEV